MQLHLQGLDDGNIQSRFRLADAANVDLMLITLDTQLMIAKPLIRSWLRQANVVMDATIDQEGNWAAGSLLLCIQTFYTCDPQSS